MTGRDPLVEALQRHRGSFSPVVPFDLRHGGVTVFDFTGANRDLERVGIHDTVAFTEYLFERIVAGDVPVGVGRYNEDRVLYRHSPLFDSDAERRSIHLGLDLFVAGGTPVLAPLPGRLHSFADNDRLGDYGPTVILEHSLDGTGFYTLYGHLNRASLDSLGAGRRFAAGDEIAMVGEHHENGGWPPHLHFQIIRAIGDGRGDFPGVAAPTQRDAYLGLCPDPNLILGIPGL